MINQQKTKMNLYFVKKDFRSYANLSTSWKMNKFQYTKYRIAKPWTSNTYFDDIYLSQPNKEDFAKFTKETPLFLRFLKIMCDLENRPSSFIFFAKRCETGLVVEKDVYITKEELMDCIWRNGFTEAELNAFEVSFPSDYRFHYPELAVLFDLEEEDCYKYCLKKRAANPQELVELNYKPPKNLLSSYGLCFLGVWFGLSNTVLSNAWFYSKTFPFGAVFYMLASYFYRQIREYLWKEEKMLIDGAKEKKCTSESFVYDQMKKYANDARCLEYLSSFKSDVQQQLAAYRKALIEGQKQHLANRMNQKLLSIFNAERSMQASLQEVIVNETAESFRVLFKNDVTLKELAFRSAVDGLAITNKSENKNQIQIIDPVGDHFKNALNQLQNADLTETLPDPKGTVIQRVAAVFQQKENEFLDQFTVKAEEAENVKKLIGKCKTENGAFDFNLLSEEQLKRLDELYNTINNRVGFEAPHESILMDQLKPLDSHSQPFADYVNQQVNITMQGIRNRRLTAFAEAFQ